MNRIQRPLLCALLALAACEKKPAPTENPDPTAGTGDGGKVVELDDSVPQEPDPAELAQAARQYLAGEYAQVIEVLGPMYADLKQRKQYRASALAGSWLALAHAEGVFENGKEPAEWAASMAASTDDPEVDAAAQLAMGAYLIGNEEFDAALGQLDGAATAADPSLAALGLLLRAEALIGGAFGGSESESVQHPEKFDEAKAAYEAAAAKAKGHAAEDLLMGRVEEGFAALADYRKAKDEVCTHADASIKALTRGGAKRLLEGPVALARDNKCPLPAEFAETEAP